MSARTDQTLEFWSEKGYHVTKDNSKLIDECNVIVIAVKPQILDKAMEDLYMVISYIYLSAF